DSQIVLTYNCSRIAKMRTLDTEEKVLVGLAWAFAVLGLAFAGVGIWCLADTSTLLGYANSLYYNSQGSNLFGLQPGFTLVPCGLASVFALPICMAATCRPSKSFLIAFIVYMCILLLVELPMTITVLAGWPTTKTTLQTALENSMKDDYVGLPYSYTHNEPNSLIFDKLMLENKCCGINSNTDFTNNYLTYASVWYNGYRSYALGNGTSLTASIPAACCMYNNVQTMINNSDWLNYRNYMQNQLCPYNQGYSYAVGCYSTLTTSVYSVISLSVGCYFIPIIVQVAALVASGVVYHTAHHANEVADWTQYDKRYNNGRTGRNGRGQQQQQQQQRQSKRPDRGQDDDEVYYTGRDAERNSNQYGGGWGSNNYRRA
ncbi:hypothetical protein BOX15_Mlig022892g4, partial [Macrostomum lignano]